MKTAVSLPDDLFQLADDYARQRDVSRSELYANALREYIDAHQRDDLTSRINKAIEGVDASLPADLERYNRKKLLEADW